MEKMKFETVDGTVRNVDKIAEMFPQVVTEVLGEDGKLKRAVKLYVLKELLSGDYVEGGECYEFTWPGKRAAIAEAAKPIRKTLRPCKEESKNWDTTENLYIEGDNLEVLKLLQESYLGKVKMIYIDPPYNTGNDGDLIACFDANIPESAIRTIAKRQPLRAVFRDSSFASAPQKINVEEIFKLFSPTTTVKVI